MLIKVCGLTHFPENSLLLTENNPDFLGTIQFPQSPRYFPNSLKTSKPVIGVFVNADLDELLSKIEAFQLAGVQLHGDESPELCAALPKELIRIKAFRIADARDFSQTENYAGSVSYLLFDTKTEVYGGTGQQFDWNLLNNYTGNTPFILSGGINEGDLERIKKIQHPQFAGVDLNSCFETAPGKKDAARVLSFIKKLKA